MSWPHAILLALLGFVLALASVRSVPRRRWLTVLVLDFPLLVLIVRWAAFRHAWADLAVGLAGSVLAFAGWWILRGRKLGPPRDDNIRVWTQDDPPE